MNAYTRVSKAVQADSAYRASLPAAWQEPRSATVEYNEWQRYPWMVRKYGYGRCTRANGMPCYYSSEEHARQVADTWVEQGL